MSDNPGDALLSDLCSICHLNHPKYRCPRCLTRTCSLPCSRRHKLWSQCSGVRDPAAYLRRSELATESAFDHDFNFITGVERRIERAGRDAEDRGVHIDHSELDAENEPEAGKKRKRPHGGLVKGEAGFLRGIENAGVRVVRAPRGMTRDKQNTSKWNPKNKCLIWTVEWIDSRGEKLLRNSLEISTVAEAYDRAKPRPKGERAPHGQTQEQESSESKPEDLQDHEQKATNEAVPSEAVPETANTQDSYLAEQKDPSKDGLPEVEEAQSEVDGQPKHTDPSTPVITPHRDLYFYLHRPQTSTKQPVLIPLPPSTSLTTALRDRTVLEFPTIYVLNDSPEALFAVKQDKKFLLEEEYIRSEVFSEDRKTDSVASREDIGQDPDNEEGEVSEKNADPSSVKLDEKKVLEVLKQDLFENGTAGEAER